MIWRVDSLGDFYSCNEDTVVYFDRASGNTHLLNEFAAFLLQQLDGQPMETDQLIAKITPELDPHDLVELTQAIPGILAELVALDLVDQF